MRLQISKNSAQERLLHLQNEGLQLLSRIQEDYRRKRSNSTFNQDSDIALYQSNVAAWIDKVVKCLNDIFPTSLESNAFVNAPTRNTSYRSGENAKYGSLRNRLQDFVASLEQIINDNLPRYTDLPIGQRLYIEDVDSFAKVRDVNPQMVAAILKDGYVDLSEDHVQRALESILNVPFHQEDWGGEINDLYATNLTVNGQRVASAFLLKGNGLKRREMRIADCGKNGDQIVRLFQSPATLFVVQFVGQISQAVITDVETKVSARQAEGKSACFCIIDGQDTARLLHAYGEL